MPPLGPPTTAGYWGSTYWSKGYWGADYWKQRATVPAIVPLPYGGASGGAGAFRVDSLDNCEPTTEEIWDENVKLLTENSSIDKAKLDRAALGRCLRDLQEKVERLRRKLDRNDKSTGRHSRRRRESDRLQTQIDILMARIRLIELNLQIKTEQIQKPEMVEKVIERVIYVPQPAQQAMGMGDLEVGWTPSQYAASAAIAGLVTHFVIPDDWEVPKGIGYAATAILALKALQGVLSSGI